MSEEKKKNIFIALQEEISSLEKEEEGLRPSALLSLPDNLREIMTRVIRLDEVTAGQLARDLGKPLVETERLLSEQVAKGYLKEEKTYRVPLGRKKTTKLPQSIWASLEKKF